MLWRDGMEKEAIINKMYKLYQKTNTCVEKGIDKLQTVSNKYDPRKDGSNGDEVIIHGAAYQRYGTPFFFRKKHYCEKCSALLVTKKREKIVNSFSEEAKNYDFSLLDTYLVGNIKFVTYYFECSNCKTIYENLELIRIEKEKRKKKIKQNWQKIKKRISKNQRKK